MKSSISIATLLALLAGLPAAGGELVTLPLDLGAPELFVDIGGADLVFDADRPLDDITAVRLHVTGHYPGSRLVCWQDGNIGAGVQYGEGDAGLFQGLVADGATVAGTEHVFGGTTDGSETFDLELDFNTPPAGWDFLAAGTGTVRLLGLDCPDTPGYPIICICDHSAVLESAEIRIQLGEAVAAESENWGTIKTRFR